MLGAFHRSITRSPTRICVVFVGLILFLLKVIVKSGHSSVAIDGVRSAVIVSPTLSDPFEKVAVNGFANTRVPDGPNCEQLHVAAELAVTQSVFIDDDLLDIASSVGHPLIDYVEQPKGQKFATTVEKTWGRMAGASVWLEKHGVYMTISRVYYYNKGVRHWPVMSFIRAQIHDASWSHLRGYVLNWHEENITFPRILDVSAPYEIGGGFYGPEDPRVIIEQDVPDAEPVIIFNMLEDTKTSIRSMHIFRPFSNFTTKLYIEHQNPGLTEKNWSPFFMPPPDVGSEKRWPSQYLHFVYDYHPLWILRCHVLNGACSWAYKQEIPQVYGDEHQYKSTPDVMRGGTNFVLINLSGRSGLRTFVGLPRTHCSEGCGFDAMYRPELMVLTTNGTHFWIDYASEPLSFGHAVLSQALIDDACDSGRILIANSIARVNDVNGQDEMTVSFTVGDRTVQSATVKGVRGLVQNLPQFNYQTWRDSNAQWTLNVTHDVLLCSVRSATEFALANTTPAQTEQRRKKKEEDEAKAAEEQKEKIAEDTSEALQREPAR